MFRYLGLGVVLSVIRGEITLSGIEFGDNFGQEYLTGQNGIAIARTKVKLMEAEWKMDSCNQILQIATQLTFCAWIYPVWSRWTNLKLGAFEIKTTETLNDEEKIVAVYLRFDESGDLTIMASYVHLFHFNVSIASVNILRRVLFLIKIEYLY